MWSLWLDLVTLRWLADRQADGAYRLSHSKLIVTAMAVLTFGIVWTQRAALSGVQVMVTTLIGMILTAGFGRHAWMTRTKQETITSTNALTANVTADAAALAKEILGRRAADHEPTP